MIMARNEDGTYSQVGFVKDNAGIDTEYIYDKDGDIVFEKGFTRETSGTVPLTINGIGKDLKAWSITGNTVQDGTPTPENPVEVQAVGDRTANLFDILTVYSDTTKFTINKNSVTATGRNFDAKRIKLADVGVGIGDAFVFSANILNSVTGVMGRVCASIGGVIKQGFYKNVLEPYVSSITGTMETNEDAIWISYGNTGEINASNIMLNLGSTALPYEPYGYKIPVVTRGKNLIDVANLTGKTDALFTDNINPKLAQVKFDEAAQYTISMKFEIDTSIGWRKITFTYTDGTTSVSPWIVKSGVFKYTSTSGKTIAKVEFTNYNYYGDVYVEYIQLESGTEATEYSPYIEPITTQIYLPTPLYSGEVLRSDGSREVKLKGTKIKNIKWEYESEHSRFASEYINNKIPAAPGRYIIGYSDIYECLQNGEEFDISWNKKFYIASSGRTIQIYIHDTRFNNVNDFVSSAGEYKIYFPVALTTETVTAPQIPTLNGTTVIDVDTAVKPTEMYIKYKSSK